MALLCIVRIEQEQFNLGIFIKSKHCFVSLSIILKRSPGRGSHRSHMFFKIGDLKI